MTSPDPLEGAREAPLSDVEMVLYNHYRHLDCPGTVDLVDPEDCASVAVESIRALSSAGYLLVRPDLSDATPLPTADDMPVLRRRMLTMLLDQMGPEAMSEALAGRGYQVSKEIKYEDVTSDWWTHVRRVWRSPWVPVSGEGRDD